jgi:hypothetical protein
MRGSLVTIHTAGGIGRNRRRARYQAVELSSVPVTWNGVTAGPRTLRRNNGEQTAPGCEHEALDKKTLQYKVRRIRLRMEQGRGA